jgi:hypothetical protein
VQLPPAPVELVEATVALAEVTVELAEATVELVELATAMIAEEPIPDDDVFPVLPLVTATSTLEAPPPPVFVAGTMATVGLQATAIVAALNAAKKTSLKLTLMIPPRKASPQEAFPRGGH